MGTEHCTAHTNTTAPAAATTTTTTTTPTPKITIIFTCGILYATQRIDKKQLLYLYKILRRKDEDWTRTILKVLEQKRTEWNKRIQNVLRKYNLPTDLDTIKAYNATTWKNTITMVIEEKNKERITRPRVD